MRWNRQAMLEQKRNRCMNAFFLYIIGQYIVEAFAMAKITVI